MAVSLLVGVPAIGTTLAVGGPISFRIAFGTLAAVMALLALASAAVAVWKSRARYSLRDVSYFTLLVALGCGFVTSSGEDERVAIVLAAIPSIALWWTKREPSETRGAHVLRLLGNGVVVAVTILLIFAGFLSALSMALEGRGR